MIRKESCGINVGVFDQSNVVSIEHVRPHSLFLLAEDSLCTHLKRLGRKLFHELDQLVPHGRCSLHLLQLSNGQSTRTTTLDFADSIEYSPDNETFRNLQQYLRWQIWLPG